MLIDPLLTGILGLLAPERAYADYGILNNIVSTVGGFLPSLSTSFNCDAQGGGCGFASILMNIVSRLQPLIYGLGALTITIYGFRMIISQEDDAREKWRTVATACVSGMVLSALINPFIAAFYGTTGDAVRGSFDVQIVNTQVTGIINWALVIAAPFAMIAIIVSAMTALLAPTDEESITKMRATIVNVVIGIVLIVFRFVIADTIGTDGQPSPNPMLAVIVNVLSFVLSFMALAAVLVIIYAGVLMILNLGNEERVSQAKGLIARAVIGLVVIIVSLALVRFVMGAAV